MANDFFQKDENYDVPSVSNYMRFEEGENRFRILGAFSDKNAIQGLLYWKTIGDKRQPIRLKKNANGSFPSVPMSELEMNKFGDLDTPKYFWAFPVWNYNEKKVQILEITQKTILKHLQTVIKNSKWGDPRDYDFIVTKGKEGGKTVYSVTNDPKEKIDEAIVDEFVQMSINMEALFSGDDPFAAVGDKIADDADKALNDSADDGLI